MVLYPAKRKELPVNAKFDLGFWEVPVLVVAIIWLVFELSLSRDAGRKDAWLRVWHSIDAVIDRDAGTRPS